MSAGQIAVLVASILCLLAVIGLLGALGSLRREVRALRRVADDLRRQTVPLVADAQRVVDQAATEMERVGAVLDSTESVHATVDSASKLAYRAFANPVVKVLAVRAGAATGIRRLASGAENREPERFVAVGERTVLTVPKRTFWLVTGAAIGAGSSLWAERRVRRTVQQAAARLQPDALVVEVGRSARQVAGTAGDRVRDAVVSGRDEMQRREEELWAELAAQAPGADPGGRGADVGVPPPRTAPVQESAHDRPNSRRRRRTSAKSPSHLGK